ncbi:MAG: hypothetical protein PHV59_07080 [Victivallales bacterium]|nr:hypothetical protein [Victivallales bacterium]
MEIRTLIAISCLLLTADYCRADFNTDNDFRKYGFVSSRNLLFRFGLWGYRTEYNSRTQNTLAYALAKTPLDKDRVPFDARISFRFKARLYPVAPDTQNLKRVIKADVKNSLGVIKTRKYQNGIVCSPAFVVAMQETLGRGKESHRSFPIQYSKTEDDLEEQERWKEGHTLIFKDTRLLPFNLFTNYDIEVCYDYANKIISFNCNGNKVIMQNNLMSVWRYFGLATLFSAIGRNKNTVFALEYEFTTIKVTVDGTASGISGPPPAPPRLNCDYYRDIIKKRKDDVDAMFCLGMNYYEGAGTVLKDYFEAFKWFKKAALKDHVFAQYYLGLCYLYGRGTEIDAALAWKWFFRSAEYYYDRAQVMAAQCIIDQVRRTNELERAKLLQKFLGPAFFQGNANACYLQSYCAYYDVAKRNIKYLEGFRDAARRGHPKAFYYLGKRFISAAATRKTAFRCYHEAAARGFIPAFTELGKCYFLGIGTAEDPDAAFKNFEQAAHGGDSDGTFYLACCYLTGQGVEADRERALRLFAAAADRDEGSPRARIALLLLGEKAPAGTPLSKFFYGDDGAASAEVRRAGNSTAVARRALGLKYGIGTVKRPEQALKLLAGLPERDAGMEFEFGDSCEQYRSEVINRNRALGAYEKAFRGGNIRAGLRLGRLYAEFGDKTRAKLYWRYAADKGCAAAAYELARLILAEGGGSRVAREKEAFRYFKKAADAGHIRAACLTGEFYYRGQGVHKNAADAARYWKQYESAFEKRQNNSIHGIYWKPLPYQRPLELDKNGLPLKYFSHLKDKGLILQYYKKY